MPLVIPAVAFIAGAGAAWWSSDALDDLRDLALIGLAAYALYWYTTR